MTSISGYAAIFNNIDSDGDILLKESISNIDDLCNLYWQHKLNHQIGKIESMRQDHIGLFIKATIWDDAPKALTIAKSIRTHRTTGLSIGFIPLETKMIHGKKIRIIKLLRLIEISVVSKPANHLSQIKAISY
jgi:HK97 family phage prohead protease